MTPGTNDRETPRQALDLAHGGDGCCHKTRIKDGPCPIGWTCPYIVEIDIAQP